MSTHEWRDPTLVWLRLRQLQVLGFRMARQTGKTPSFGRLQEELFHTAQLLPPPPEKPYYNYTPPVSLHNFSYKAVGGNWKYPRGQTPFVTNMDTFAYFKEAEA